MVIAVLQADGRRFGLVVDRVLNTEEIVVKPLGGQLKAIGLYAGATILGDGKVALILDVQALARRALRTETTERGQEAAREASAPAAASETDRQRLLLAAIGGGRRVAIPLDTVTRLEEVRADAVEHVGSREVVQYRGAILPMVRLDRHLGAYGETEREVLAVVVYTDDGRSVASWSRRSSTSSTARPPSAATSTTSACSAPPSSAPGDRAARRPRRRSSPPTRRSTHAPARRRRAPSPPTCWRSDVTAPTKRERPRSPRPAASSPPSGWTATSTASRSSTCRRCSRSQS